MQIVVLWRIFKQLPANLANFLKALNEAVYLKVPFLIFQALSRKFFADELTIEKMKAEVMASWGIEDSNYFWSLGILFAIFLLILMLILLWLFVKIINRLRKCGKTAEKVADWLDKKLFFGALSRYLIESYLKLVFTTLVFLTADADLSAKSPLHIGLSILFAILLLLPFIISGFLFAYQEKLDSVAFKKRFESLYLGVKTNKYLRFSERQPFLKIDNYLSYLYSLFFCVRRLAVIFCLHWMKEDNYLWCTYSLMAVQMAYVNYMITVKPHKDSYHNSLEIFNEVLIFLMIFSMQSFNSSSIEPLVEAKH